MIPSAFGPLAIVIGGSIMIHIIVAKIYDVRHADFVARYGWNTFVVYEHKLKDDQQFLVLSVAVADFILIFFILKASHSWWTMIPAFSLSFFHTATALRLFAMAKYAKFDSEYEHQVAQRQLSEGHLNPPRYESPPTIDATPALPAPAQQEQGDFAFDPTRFK